MEDHSPGLTASINDYNEIIRELVVARASDKIHLIDNHDLILNAGAIEDYILKEDGHHLTAAAHRMLSARLIDLEIANDQDLRLRN